MKKLFILFGLPLLLVSCSGTEPVESTQTDTTTKTTTTIDETTTTEESMYPQVSIHLSNGKSIDCELYPDIAPITVANFLSLVDSGFYNNLIFHRVMPGFVVQAGGFYMIENTVYQKSATTIKGEFSANGVENNLHHEAGVLSLARATPYDSGSSQFFICVAECKSLDGQYAGFGKVLNQESLNNAIELSLAETTTKANVLKNFPVNPVSITSITRIANEV